MLVAVCALLFILVIIIYHYSSCKTNLPPGPWGLPLVGCFPWEERIRKERTYLKWWREFGQIFTVSSFAGLKFVVLCDAELIRDAFSRAGASNRATLPGMNDLTYMDVGILFSNGELWQRARRFTLHHLRNFGMGRSRMEAVINGQISQFMDEVLKPSVGRPVSVEDSLKIAIANIIWGVISGEQFNIHDTRALGVMKTFETVSDHIVALLILGLCPWTKNLPETWTGAAPVRKKMNIPIDRLFGPAIAEHRRTIVMDTEPRDYIDALLQEQARDPEMFTERHMIRSLLDLFFAGFDTTGSMMLWMLLFLAKHPEVQARMRKELHETLGESRPSLADRPKLPFTEAVLMEVQRLANVAPYGLEHITTEAIKLREYTIPPGTMLVSLLCAVHMDPANFEEPEAFRPDRFLDAEDKLKPSKTLMPFSAGKRACPGEGMARAELFLFVTCIVKRYRFRFPDGFQHDLSVHEKKMMMREPTPFQLVLEEISTTE